MLNRRRRSLLLPFLTPAVLIYGLFFLWPALRTVMISFTSWSGVTMDMSFAGITNYLGLLRDPIVATATRNTVTLVLVAAVITFPLALYFVTVAEGTSRRAKSLRFAVVVPAALSVAVVALLWKWIYDPGFGLLNGILRGVGLGGLTQTWLGDTSIALFALVVAVVWHTVGIWVIFLAAAVARVPAELKESVPQDGRCSVTSRFLSPGTSAGF